MLLPPEERPEEDEEEIDPKAELIRQLIEYKKFKEAASTLEKMEETRRLYFPREAVITEETSEQNLDLGSVSLFDLLSAFSEILQKVQVREDLKRIFEEEVSVDDKIDFIERSISQKESFHFRELFEKVSSRMEIIATFLALLELIRLKKVRVFQKQSFADILIQRAAAL
jgi:segregation and condensation protein A